MSYSSDVKKELCGVLPKNIHCRTAELAGIISINGRIEKNEAEKEFLIIRTENKDLEEKIIKLLRMVVDISEDEIIRSNEIKHHRKILIKKPDNIEKLFLKLKLRTNGTRVGINGILTERNCCKTSYLRGAFLAGGSVGDPKKKAYQFEIQSLSNEEADKLIGIIKSMHYSAKCVERRDRYVVYVKDGDTIASILGSLGAVNSYMEFENIRIVKDIRNKINREVNCDTANMAKTASAASKQLEDIKLIESTIGLDSLPDSLKVMAIVRKENPYSSMKELSELMNPPIGKSGISHRLRKLSEIADGLK